MKKILTILSGLAVVGGASSTVVSCGEKTIISLNDSTYNLKLADDSGTKIDIMRWSSDVITADAYKTKFISTYKEHNLGWNNDKQPLTILEIVKGEDKTAPTLISQFLADYQKSSNTANTKEFSDAATLDEELTYRIFDLNQGNSKAITTFNGDGNKVWTDESNEAKLVSQYNEDTDVSVIHFKIEITTTYSKFFTGAKADVVKDELTKYYPDIKENQIPTSDTFDYRFDIQFYYNLS